MFEKTVRAEDLGIYGKPENYLQKLIDAVSSGLIPEAEIVLENGGRIEIARPRKKPLRIYVSSGMDDDKYRACLELLPYSIRDFNKSESPSGTWSKCNAYILKKEDTLCIRPSKMKAGAYEAVYADKPLPLPGELSDKCAYLLEQFNSLKYYKKGNEIESLEDFFESSYCDKDRVILGAENLTVSEHFGGLCVEKVHMFDSNQQIYLDVQPKQNHFDALVLINDLFPDSKNFLGPWDGGNSKCFGSSCGLESYLKVLELEIKPDHEFKVNRLKSGLR